MTDEAVFAAVNGQRLTSCRLTVPNGGAWVADVDFEADPDVSGAVTLKLAELELKGTVAPAANGTFGLQRRARIVAGAGGWGTPVAAKGYHNDAGVKAKLVAEDAARAVGESIGDFLPAVERVGVDYARQAGRASVALEDAAGGVPWWVDYAGVTHVRTRPAVRVDAKVYQLLAFDPREQVATLGVDDLSKLPIGATLVDERLPGVLVVRALEAYATAETFRVRAWCGGVDASTGRLVDLLRSITRRDDRLYGHYRYRVVRMNGDRVELQAVRARAGLPDLLPLSVMPGIAGAHAKLAAGAEVLVVFEEGSRARPIVVAFAGKDGTGFVPDLLTFGGDSGAPAARQGDAVEVLLPPAVFSGTISGAPASGVLTFPLMKTLGTITAGSGKVRIA